MGLINPKPRFGFDPEANSIYDYVLQRDLSILADVYEAPDGPWNLVEVKRLILEGLPVEGARIPRPQPLSGVTELVSGTQSPPPNASHTQLSNLQVNTQGQNTQHQAVTGFSVAQLLGLKLTALQAAALGITPTQMNATGVTGSQVQDWALTPERAEALKLTPEQRQVLLP